MYHHRLTSSRLLACLALAFAPSFVLAPQASAQDEEYGGGEESGFSINGMLRVQGGVFAPLPAEKFNAHKNVATNPASGVPCDVRNGTTACVPSDHTQEPGSLSIARATLQIESQWDINKQVGVHAIVRGVRSLKLPGDVYGRPPQQNLEAWQRAQDADRLSDAAEAERQRKAAYDDMGKTAQDYVHDNYYTELELREFYLDLIPSDWFSMRIGRQQVMWGDIGGYRLLDVVNPQQSLWHFAPLEAIEDVNEPLWMWLTTLDMPSIDHSLELLWVPMLDRPKDTVTAPLSFGGAWGVPYSNAPTNFFSPNLVFDYPDEKLRNSRAGFRWKGSLGANTNYSLVYYYTHQLSPPIPTHGYYAPSEPVVNIRGMADPDTGVVTGQGRLAPSGGFSSLVTSEIHLVFPRQHIAGFSLEQNLPALGTIARLEAVVEPNRTFGGRTDLPLGDPKDPSKLVFQTKQMAAYNYAVMLQRPTMIRFLNPTQNFLLVASFFHSIIPQQDMNTDEGRKWVNLTGYNNWQLQRDTYRVIALARTNYLHGMITLEMLGVYMPNPYADESGFYTVDVGFRMGPHYRLNVRATDFVGKDPYRDLGLFRDRDEVVATLTTLF